MRLELGTRVHCSDGVLGELADVVIDPTARRVKHLVVRPDEEEGEARLVPAELAKEGEGEGIALRCTLDEARRLPAVEEFAYLRLGDVPVEDPDWDVGVQNVLAMPYYDATGMTLSPGTYGGETAVFYDRVPKGEVEIRRASAVWSADGHHLGHVDGFVVADDDAITHVVLERGHLWGRREVTIPIGAVERSATDEIHLSLSKDDVGRLPAVRVGRWGS
jgi:hypothetical protein